MKLSIINTYLTVTVLLFSVIACNPKEEIVPENPCGNYKQPTADFIMEQTTGDRNTSNTDYLWYHNQYNTKDTVTLANFIQFRSEFSDTNLYKHTWYVGSEVIRNYKVWRDFLSVPRPSIIAIHHAVKWNPNKKCNPNDDGYDSVSFTFRITDRVKDLNTYGKYRMVYDTVGAPANQDSVDIELYCSKINNKDSVLSEPLDRPELQILEFRVRGLYTTSLPNGNIQDSSNRFALRTRRVISNNFILLEPTVDFLGDLQIYIDKNKTTYLQYRNYSLLRKMKGRRLY
ncbi:MAG: hypothetical protein V4620_05575 [Bacteroidota bacterium]